MQYMCTLTLTCSCRYIWKENCLAHFASAARQKEWFDALIDLQAVLNVDLQQEMGRQGRAFCRFAIKLFQFSGLSCRSRNLNSPFKL